MHTISIVELTQFTCPSSNALRGLHILQQGNNYVGHPQFWPSVCITFSFSIFVIHDKNAEEKSKKNKRINYSKFDLKKKKVSA